MVLSDMKVGYEFYMDGLSFPDNNPVKTKCTLIEYKGMNKYVIDADNCLILCDGEDNVYPIIDDMVYDSETDKWISIDECK